MKPIVTSRDMAKKREAAQFNPREHAMLRKVAEFNACLAKHPEIGTLIRNGRPIYYVNNPYREARDPRQLGGA